MVKVIVTIGAGVVTATGFVLNWYRNSTSGLEEIKKDAMTSGQWNEFKAAVRMDPKCGAKRSGTRYYDESLNVAKKRWADYRNSEDAETVVVDPTPIDESEKLFEEDKVENKDGRFKRAAKSVGNRFSKFYSNKKIDRFLVNFKAATQFR